MQTVLLTTPEKQTEVERRIGPEKLSILGQLTLLTMDQQPEQTVQDKIQVIRGTTRKRLIAWISEKGTKMLLVKKLSCDYVFHSKH